MVYWIYCQLEARIFIRQRKFLDRVLIDNGRYHYLLVKEGSVADRPRILLFLKNN